MKADITITKKDDYLCIMLVVESDDDRAKISAIKGKEYAGIEIYYKEGTE